MEYKNTLNILKTNFEMKANLPTKEPSIQKFWADNNIYQKLLLKNKEHEQWILHDGPPYANGDIHVGHALNKIIKDIIVRHKSLKGFYSPFIPGWDTHGLPIEHSLLKKGINKDPTLTISQKRKNCREFAIKNVEKQLEQFKRLGIVTDWKEKYLTLTTDFETRQLELFLAILQQGLVYQDLKPIYWSWSSRTALAEAEIEYANIQAPSIYITFDVINGKGVLNQGDKLIIWTTTPWTIPSNLAIAVHPDFTYVKVKVDNNHYVLLKQKLSELSKEFKWETYEIEKEFNGKQIELVQYKHCLYDRVSPVINATYVTSDNGTGLVHNAPGFGVEDYIACKAYNIPIFCPIDEAGKFTSEVNDENLSGVFYETANEQIINRLDANKALLKFLFINHNAAIDWRTKKPVIYRATKQWFVNIDPIKNKILTEIDRVKFNNALNKKQLISMISNRKEWCISRQRVWGVPIPIIFDEYKKPILEFELIQNIINIIGKEGSDIWFEKPVEYFLTKKYLDKKQKFTKEKDIMDVWFDSGSSFTLLKAKGLNYPADLYFEGNDQYRGWFNSSIINSTIYSNKAPFKQLLSHGFTLDEQGRKMSKSLGNVIDPNEVCKQFGADVLRLWAASSNYQEDVSVSKNILTQCAETYRRIRNSLFKFVLANISDFSYSKNKKTEFDEYDKFVLSTLKINLAKINKAFDNFDFLAIVKIINLHVIDLSANYFDVIKDILYCEKIDNPRRRTIQTVLYTILKTYLIILSPIIPHTCEEVYSFFNVDNKKESIILEDWVDSIEFNEDVNTNKWINFFELKKLIYAELEIARNNGLLKKSNEAKIIINSKELPFDIEDIKKYLNVAVVEFNPSESTSIKVEKSGLIKCQRCWNYFSKKEMYDEDICHRCAKVLE